MPVTEPFSLESAQATLRGFVTLPDRPGERPAVIICHGFKGFMEWGFFPALAELLAQRGFVAVRFNFRGSGMSPGDELVTDLEAFGHATVGGDVADLAQVLEATGDEIAPGRVDGRRIGVLGHSRGGGAALLVAHRPDVSALVTWAAVSGFDRLSATAKRAWRENGETLIVNARTGQAVAISSSVLDDLEAHADDYDLIRAAGRRSCPWLLVHGTDDPTVPFTEARTLADAASDPFRFLEVSGADHTFGAKHPFAGPTPQLIEAMNATQEFFLEHLRESPRS